MTDSRHIGIANWTENGDALRLVVALELRVGELAGDVAARGFQTVEHEPCPAGVLTLSATHVLIDRAKRRRDAMISCGAGIPEIPRVEGIAWDEGWNRDLFEDLRDLAEHWHLNTMRAACAHQAPVYAPDRYGREVPSLDLTPACPETGYKYGHAWLVEPMPAEVLAYFRRLIEKGRP